jgi:ketosteroid isomerase-like protein
MKNKLLFVLAAGLLVLAACNPKAESTAKVPETDSLMNPWIAAWNASDVDKITSLFAGDAVVILPDTLMAGIELVKKAWIVPSAATLRNLTVKNHKVEKSDDLVSMSGSYIHDWMKNDSITGHAKGFYTFLWKKLADNNWKIVVVNIN